MFDKFSAYLEAVAKCKLSLRLGIEQKSKPQEALFGAAIASYLYILSERKKCRKFRRYTTRMVNSISLQITIMIRK